MPLERAVRRRRSFVALLGLACVVALIADPAFADLAHHPFAIGANEGAVGHQTGVGAWILGRESDFFLRLAGAVHAVKTSPTGFWLLVGLSFAYGVFHAAGPGHGKAVIASYMVSNEAALRRGLVIALSAALLQAIVATAIVAIAALVFDATAARMTAAAQAIELASYLGIVALGLVLVWRKGRALLLAFRPVPVPALGLLATAAASPSFGGFSRQMPDAAAQRFFADDGRTHVHDAACGCGHSHMPDPALFGGRNFDLRAAATAVVTAGARPCSGAILVLVFALSQGVFLAGIAATFAMALGTAVTTGALAAVAVFFKDVAIRLSNEGSRLVVGRLVELAAAAGVLLFGLLLLAASFAGFHAAS
jgi:nickel/cobalt exporter